MSLPHCIVSRCPVQIKLFKPHEWPCFLLWLAPVGLRGCDGRRQRRDHVTSASCRAIELRIKFDDDRGGRASKRERERAFRPVSPLVREASKLEPHTQTHSEKRQVIVNSTAAHSSFHRSSDQELARMYSIEDRCCLWLLKPMHVDGL